MNSIRLPATLLVVVLVALGAWYARSRQESASSPTPPQAAAEAAPAGHTSAPPSAQPSAPQALASDSTTTDENMQGSWQSTDDPNYSVVIGDGGKWTDNYIEADASSSISETGAYTLFTSADPDPGFTGSTTPGTVYIKLVEGTATYYYRVLEADDTNLQLEYLARGNTLSFTKVQ